MDTHRVLCGCQPWHLRSLAAARFRSEKKRESQNAAIKSDIEDEVKVVSESGKKGELCTTYIKRLEGIGYRCP